MKLLNQGPVVKSEMLIRKPVKEVFEAGKVFQYLESGFSRTHPTP